MKRFFSLGGMFLVFVTMFGCLETRDAVYWAEAAGKDDFDFVEFARQHSDGSIASVSYTNLGTTSNPVYGALCITYSSSGSITSQCGYTADIVFDVKEKTSGGYIFAGNNITSIGSAGDIQWSKKISEMSGGSSVSLLSAAAAQLKDGNFIFVTANKSAINGSALVCVDAAGGVVWSKTYSGAADCDFNRDIMPRVCALSDGGFVVAESADYLDPNGAGYNMGWENIWLKKYTGDGSLVWEKVIGAPDCMNTAFNVKEASQGDILVCGVTYGMIKGHKDALIIKCDSAGNMQWAKAYGYDDSSDPNYEAAAESAYDIMETADGGYIFTGCTSYKYSARDNINGWVVKLSNDGSVSWSRIYIATIDIVGRKISAMANGSGYLTASRYLESISGPNWDIGLSTIDAAGNIPGGYVPMNQEQPHLNDAASLLSVKTCTTPLVAGSVAAEAAAGVKKISTSAVVR